MIDSDSGVFDFEQQFLLLEKSLYLTALSILRNPERRERCGTGSNLLRVSKAEFFKKHNGF